MVTVHADRSSRYQMLSSLPDLQDESGEITGLRYVSFIKNLPHELTTEDTTTKPTTATTASTATSSTVATKLAKSAPPASPVRQKTKNPLKEVREITKKNAEEHAKKLKEIEECKFECKQTDRVLKRVEGDIIQRGKKLRKIMKEYETDVYRKQRKEEENVIQASLEERSVKQKTAVEDVKLTKDRIHRNTVSLQQEKETDNKISNTMNQVEQR